MNHVVEEICQIPKILNEQNNMCLEYSLGILAISHKKELYSSIEQTYTQIN